MDWRVYEKQITEHFRHLYPSQRIEHDVKRAGIFSKTQRQVDILISASVAGFRTEIAIDCKYFSTKIDVCIVEQFISFLADIKVGKGVIITNVGFTDAAVQRALNDGRDIEVTILDFEDLESFKGVGGSIIYREDNGALVPCPSGWEFHSTPIDGLIGLYSRPGVTWEQALENREVIYPQIADRKEFREIDDLLSFHKSEGKDKQLGAKSTINRNPGYPFRTKKDCPLVLRRTDVNEYPEPEITIFIQFEQLFLFFVLLAPEKQLCANLKKIAFMTKMAIPVKAIRSQPE